MGALKKTTFNVILLILKICFGYVVF